MTLPLVLLLQQQAEQALTRKEAQRILIQLAELEAFERRYQCLTPHK